MQSQDPADQQGLMAGWKSIGPCGPEEEIFSSSWRDLSQGLSVSDSVPETHQVTGRKALLLGSMPVPRDPRNNESAFFLGLLEGCFSFVLSLWLPRRNSEQREVSWSLKLKQTGQITLPHPCPRLWLLSHCSLMGCWGRGGGEIPAIPHGTSMWSA